MEFLQNENITKLKIDNNPFAKGFRETGQSRSKRKYSQVDTDIDYAHPHGHEDSANSSFESDRGICGINIDGVVDVNSNTVKQDPKERRLEMTVSSDDDACDGESVINDEKAPVEAESEHGEPLVEPRFHRPWLCSSPSSKLPATGLPLMPAILTAPQVIPASPVSSLSWTSHCLNYAQAYQYYTTFPQYYHPMRYFPTYS